MGSNTIWQSCHSLAYDEIRPLGGALCPDDAGHGVFEYDQLSTTFGQFGDERVTAVARDLTPRSRAPWSARLSNPTRRG
jgi:hypothetical protein